MPSQKRNKKQKNPLAHARGQQKAPEQLWFKRSGAGFRLFVEYYSRQPEGVIAVKDQSYETMDPGIEGCGHRKGSVGTTAIITTSSTGRTREDHTGMSRAAKRRRKKRGESTVEVPPTRLPCGADPVQNATNLALLPSAELLAVASSCSTVQPHQLPFFQTMSKPLPTTFRLRQHQSINHGTKDEHTQLVEEFVQQLSTFEDIVHPIPFSLKNEIFQSPLPKWQLPQRFKDLLMKYSQNGVLARQELGSMLPVLALPLQPGDCVVDMCASPGSKTMQALEQCCSQQNSVDTTGLVLANDVLQSRLDALRAAVDRSGVLSSDRIHYSQVDATLLKLSSPCDAVICDVPCSGDGTCRKDVHILPMWKPAAGNTLHTTQLAILKRSLELVKVGGYVCYSTCSLNPVEDEAVIAAALKISGDTIELVEITNLTQREEWIRRSGVHSWEVADYVDDKSIADPLLLVDDDDDDNNNNDEIPKLTWYKTFTDAKEGAMDGAVETLWPDDDAKRLPLERCARLLPQDYDSGGFFLALMRKLK